MKTTMNTAVMNNVEVNNAVMDNMKQLGERLMESTPMVCLGLLFSIILGEDVSPMRALRLLNTMVSALCAFLFGGFGLAVQLLLLAWFALSVWSVLRK